MRKGQITFLILLLLVVMSGQVKATEPVTISIFTLDDRPPNTVMVQQIAAVAGINLVFVDDPSQADLVSLNAAVAGSLVGSRSADPWLLEPPQLKPDALIHFAVPRAQPTVTDENIRQEYNRVIRDLEDPQLQREAADVLRGVSDPPDDVYLAAYIDRLAGWIDFLDRCDLDPDRLLVTLDDNRPGQLSYCIKYFVRRYSHHVQDGTDEGMMLLLARALRERQENPPLVLGVVPTNPGDLWNIQPFESGPVIENMLWMCHWLSLSMTPRIDLVDDWRPVIWVHGSGAESSFNDCMDILYLLEDRSVIVADIARTNGSDPALIEAWIDMCPPSGLIGYLAWNTSSNTLGSTFALWVAIDFAYDHGADPEGVRAAAETFLWARLLDDFLYQTLVRSERITLYRAEGGNPYDISDEDIQFETAEIARLITEKWHDMGESLAIPLRIVDPMGSTGFIVELPWGRFFEIELIITDSRGILPTIHPVDITKPTPL